MYVDLKTLHNPSGTYRLETVGGKTYYIRVFKNSGCETTWVRVDDAGGIKAFVAKDCYKDEQSSGWYIADVVSIVFHPNMTLKGVPAINTD